MALRLIELNSIDSQPQAGQDGTSIIRIKGGSRGVRVHWVDLALLAGAAILPTAAYNDIRLIVDDKTRRTHNITEIDDIMSLRDPALGVVDAAVPGGRAIVPIQFSEFDRKQYVASERFALDLLPNTEARIEVDSKSQAAVGSVAGYAFVEDLDDVIAEGKRQNLPNNGLNTGVMEIVRTPVNYAGTEYTISNLVNTGILYCASLYAMTNAAQNGLEPITNVQIDTDLDGIILKRSKAIHDVFLNRLKLNPSPSRFDIVPDATDNPRHALNWQQYGRFDVKVQTANAPYAGATMKTIIQKWVQRG